MAPIGINGRLNYNRAVTNVNITMVHNVYNYNVPNDRGNRVSYNGGRRRNGARPTPQELAVVRERRIPPVGAQIQHARSFQSIARNLSGQAEMLNRRHW